MCVCGASTYMVHILQCTHQHSFHLFLVLQLLYLCTHVPVSTVNIPVLFLFMYNTSHSWHVLPQYNTGC